jgi:hypothetical protein
MRKIKGAWLICILNVKSEKRVVLRNKSSSNNIVLF